MNVTLVPWQTVPEGEAAIVTDTAAVVITEAVIVFEVAGLPDGQLIFDVSIQNIRSLLAGI